MEMFSLTHALHNVSGGGWHRAWEHFSLDNDDLVSDCNNNSTMSGGACTHDSRLKDNRSTMSGGGCLSIDHRLESPKHRVSLGLHMNYYVHRKHYSQYATISMEYLWHMRRKQCTLKQFETIKIKHSRDKANDAERNHIDLGNDMLVINKTKVFLDLWQSTRSESPWLSYQLPSQK